jgi:uncharacterized protein (TIGR00375 family)
MQQYFADFHIHIGISESGKWVKIPTSNRLTLRNILHEAAERKGMQIIGIVDALSPLVRADLDRLLAEGLLNLDSQGGYRFQDKLTLILGAEIETTEKDGGTAHTLVFMPDAALMKAFALTMAKHIRNISLSSQNAHMPLAELVRIAAGFEAVIVPAHVFTPHKSLYGSCANRMSQILGEKQIAALAAVELGLSADTFMADRIAELADITFLTNSDAHSLDKIAREYNVLSLETASFQECVYAFGRKNGRSVTANFGLDPRLGKYHRTFCTACNFLDPAGGSFAGSCPQCGSKKIIHGVYDRIEEIADYQLPVHPIHRPQYQHQVPLSFIPGVGKKALEKLLTTFGTEMDVIHHAGNEAIAAQIGAAAAQTVMRARLGSADITAGGGGIYGKLARS